MLFRVIAPVDTVKQVLQDVGTGQSIYMQGEILKRLLDPENRQLLALDTDREKWEKVLVDTQATPSKLNREYHQNYPYYDQDVIWLSDHNGEDEFLGGSEFDLFIHEV